LHHIIDHNLSSLESRIQNRFYDSDQEKSKTLISFGISISYTRARIEEIINTMKKNDKLYSAFDDKVEIFRL
jgi:hypothetical protein